MDIINVERLTWMEFRTSHSVPSHQSHCFGTTTQQTHLEPTFGIHILVRTLLSHLAEAMTVNEYWGVKVRLNAFLILARI